jgi:putative effector of murein hydrolase
VAILFSLFLQKKQSTMIDLRISFLENITTDNRKKNFKSIAKQNQGILAICCGDIFQMHNTSVPVMRNMKFSNSRNSDVMNSVMGRSIDKEIAMGAQNGLASIPSTALQIVWIR